MRLPAVVRSLRTTAGKRTASNSAVLPLHHDLNHRRTYYWGPFHSGRNVCEPPENILLVVRSIAV